MSHLSRGFDISVLLPQAFSDAKAFSDAILAHMQESLEVQIDIVLMGSLNQWDMRVDR